MIVNDGLRRIINNYKASKTSEDILAGVEQDEPATFPSKPAVEGRDTVETMRNIEGYGRRRRGSMAEMVGIYGCSSFSTVTNHVPAFRCPLTWFVVK